MRKRMRMSPRHACHARKLANFCLFLFLIVFIASTALAQTKSCECEFDTKDYDAYGTNGACGVFMYNRARSCEISFSGVGANAKLLRDILGDQALANQYAEAPGILERYIAYEKEGRQKLTLQPDFIRSSLVVLARAALFRESAAKLPLKEIDADIVDFANKYSKQISATFSETAEPFEIKWGKDSVFSVGRGYVELNFERLALVRVVYFSSKPR
jgi:hypothetical protein